MLDHKKGFTLIELLSTIAIASILLMLAIPSWRQLREQSQTQALTHALLQTLAFARSQAILQQQPMTICPANRENNNQNCGSNWQQGWIIINRKNNTLIRVISTPAPKLTLSLIVLRDNNQLIFQPDGTTAGSNGHFEFSHSKIIINRGGRARVEKN